MASRIFVVDDIVAFRELLRDVLSEAGYEVRAFERASEAAEAARAECPDLVITNLRVGEESGLAMVRSLLHDPAWCDVRILLCTAATMDVEENREQLDAEGIPVMYKPFDMEQLLAQVRALLGETTEPGGGEV